MTRLQDLHLILLILLIVTQKLASQSQGDLTPPKVTQEEVREASDLTVSECSKSQDQMKGIYHISPKVSAKKVQVKVNQEGHANKTTDNSKKGHQVQENREFVNENANTPKISPYNIDKSPKKFETSTDIQLKGREGGDSNGSSTGVSERWAAGVKRVGGMVRQARSSLLSSIGK